MPALQFVPTNAGRAAIVNAEHNGTGPVVIASIGVTATAFVPSKTQTVLAGELKRLTTIAGGTVAADTIHVTIRDDSTDVYSLRGIGAYLADGTLFGTFGQAAVLLEKSGQATLLLACDVQFADIDAASITFGDTNFQLGLATTEASGIVELATDAETITGTDAQRAVTPKSLLANLNARFGAGNPSAFVKSLLDKISALAFVTALGIRGAASFDTGTGNGLDADLLDGQHGAYYRAWGNLTGVPGTFPPMAHGHVWGDLTGVPAYASRWATWDEVTGKPVTFTPAPHSHAISDVNGLQIALDAKTTPAAVATQITDAIAGKAALSGANFTGPIGVLGNVTFGALAGIAPLKHMRSDGSNLQITNHADSAYIFTLSDAGSLAVAGAITASASFISSTAYWVAAPANAAGAMFFRPQGPVTATNQMELDPNGYLYVAGAIFSTGGFQISDRRFKTNIAERPIDTQLASALAPLWSQWNRKNDDGFDTGLIAQDVQRVAPQFVNVPDDPEKMISVDKAGIALECALSADLRINHLLSRIEKLEARAA